MPLTKLNLYNCKKLIGVFGLGWGMVGGVKIGNRLRPQGNIQITFPEPSSIPLTLSLKWPLTPGNIEVFKDMPLKELTLEDCNMLTGEWARKSVV